MSYISETTIFIRNNRHYDITMKKKKWRKCVTRNHDTSCCSYRNFFLFFGDLDVLTVHIQLDVLKAYKRASLGLFLVCFKILAKIEAGALIEK